MRPLRPLAGLAALGLLALAGCGRPAATHDVAYYRDHADARQAEVADCSSKPGAQPVPDCLAALKAAGEAESKRALTYTLPASRVTNPGHL
jgi:hypothetical protein